MKTIEDKLAAFEQDIRGPVNELRMGMDWKGQQQVTIHVGSLTVLVMSRSKARAVDHLLAAMNSLDLGGAL